MTPGRMGGSPERPARFFDSPEEFGAWLALHHDTETELWMGLKKKGAVDRGLTWEQAVVEALCWGWIDSVAQRIDDESRRQRWTPARRPPTGAGSISTSSRGCGPRGGCNRAGWRSGSSAAARRRPTATSDRGPDCRTRTPRQLAASPAATAFWEASTATYRKVCAVWVTSAKQDVTRTRRMTQLIECCAAGELVPNQRYGDTPKWVERAAAAAAEAR